MSTQAPMKSEIRAGVWQAEVAGTADRNPQVQVLFQETTLTDVTCIFDSDRSVWQISATIPAHAINDGLQTFTVMGNGGDVLGHFSILAGAPLAQDLRAEISLLRAELDILKTAFRRHCAES